LLSAAALAFRSRAFAFSSSSHTDASRTFCSSVLSRCADLRDATDKAILAVPGVGRKTLASIRRFLDREGAATVT